MDGGATFYMMAATTAAGTVVNSVNQVHANELRERQLKSELKQAELAALDEETQRLQQLRLANEDMLVRSGGIDAYASPSLIAARAFNFKTAMDDISTGRFNLANERAGVAARIQVLKHNSAAVRTAGIFDLANIGLGVADYASKIGKTTLTKTSSKAAGRPLVNDPRIAGTL